MFVTGNDRFFYINFKSSITSSLTWILSWSLTRSYISNTYFITRLFLISEQEIFIYGVFMFISISWLQDKDKLWVFSFPIWLSSNSRLPKFDNADLTSQWATSFLKNLWIAIQGKKIIQYYKINIILNFIKSFWLMIAECDEVIFCQMNDFFLTIN